MVVFYDMLYQKNDDSRTYTYSRHPGSRYTFDYLPFYVLVDVNLYFAWHQNKTFVIY